MEALNNKPQATLNVALVGPAGTGKTTLFESLAFVAGAMDRRGRAGQGFLLGDPSPEAKSRGTTTEVTAARFEHEGVAITLLDTPGAVELAQESRYVLPGIDLAIVVVEPQVERMIAAAPLLHDLDSLDIPHVIVLNKMDRSDQRYRDLLDALRSVSARPVVPHHYAIGRGDGLVGYIDLVSEQAYAYQAGQASEAIPLPADYQEREQAARTEMLETLADFDDDLMEQLLDDKNPASEQVLKDLRATLGADQVVPVFMAVAEHDMGSRRLLEALLREAPRAADSIERTALDVEGPAVVQVLKTYHQGQSGKLSLVRVWRGELKDGTALASHRLAGLFAPFGGQWKPVEAAGPGAIVGLARLEAVKTGDTLSDDGEAMLAAAPMLAPMFAQSITAADRQDDVKLSAALTKLLEEDPSLKIEHDSELQQTLLWGQGDMHLTLACERLEHKHKVKVATTVPLTPYRETVRKPASSHGRHKKQSGGHGQFGDVKIDIRPLARGEGFVFENKIVGGSVPKQYIPAVEAGCREHLERGPLGFPVVDVAVTLKDGQFHSVDSSEMAFKTAAALALKEGLPACTPLLLEPILAVVISVPSDYTSKALQLLNQKRGQILGYDTKADWQGWDEVSAHLPQAEMRDLVISLRSLTQGVGFFNWSDDHLAPVPERLAEEVVARRSEAA